mgnify:CR=1 FL=1
MLLLFQVRQTWGNTTLYAPMRLVIVFSVAMGRQGTNMERSLEREQQLYGDIVQDGSFIDAYNNLSMKVVIYQHHIAHLIQMWPRCDNYWFENDPYFSLHFNS